MSVDAASFAAAFRQHATGVCLLTVQDDIDDVGTTVSAVMSVSVEPPLFAVGLASDGYPAEVLAAVGRCAVTVLGAQHAIVASRFASTGRPSARHLLESVPWRRAERSGAIVLDDGLATFDCRLERVIEAGDHVLAMLEVQDAQVLDERGAPLLRLRGRYVAEGPAGRG